MTATMVGGESCTHSQDGARAMHSLHVSCLMVKRTVRENERIYFPSTFQYWQTPSFVLPRTCLFFLPESLDARVTGRYSSRFLIYLSETEARKSIALTFLFFWGN